MTACGKANEGSRLFEKYFEASPANGYGTQRSLVADISDEDASILRQGVTYHQQADYDLALVSFRAYLESNPAPATDQPLLLAATAAIATGHYAEGEEYLNQIPADETEAGVASRWYIALLLLRRNDKRAAVWALRQIETSQNARAYPVGELLAKIP